MRSKKILSSILIVSLLQTSFSYAEVVTPQDPTICPLSAGQAAPWPGVLLNAPAVASVKFDRDHTEERMKVAVDKAVADVLTQKNGEIDREKASCISNVAQKDAVIEELNGKTKIFEQENKKLREDLANSPNRTTWFSLGFAGGILFTIATAIAIGQVVN